MVTNSNTSPETLTKSEKDNIKVDFLVDYVDDFPIYLIDYKNSGRNLYYRDAREAGTDMYNKDISKAAKDNKRIARNCLAPAIGFDSNDSSVVTGRITGYGYYWDVTFPEDLPEEIKSTYVSKKRRFDPSFSIELNEVLEDASYADAFSAFIRENFESYDTAAVGKLDIELPISYREVWEKPKDYKFEGYKGNSQLIDKIPYLDLREALSKLGFERNKKFRVYTHDGHIEDGKEQTWKAVRFAKALYETKAKITTYSEDVYASIEDASRAIDAKYDPDEKMKYRADDVGGVYRRVGKDEPEFIKLRRYSPTRESKKKTIRITEDYYGITSGFTEYSKLLDIPEISKNAEAASEIWLDKLEDYISDILGNRVEYDNNSNGMLILKNLNKHTLIAKVNFGAMDYSLEIEGVKPVWAFSVEYAGLKRIDVYNTQDIMIKDIADEIAQSLLDRYNL